MMKAIVLLSLVSVLGQFVAAQNTTGYQVGDFVEDFTLENVDGSMVSLSDYSKCEGAIVIFTCNTCQFSAAYEDRIIALDKKYKPLGFPVLAINPNDSGVLPLESIAEMRERSAVKGFSFPYLVDQEYATALKFGANRTPHAFIIANTDQGRKLLYIGAIDDDGMGGDPQNRYVEDAILAIKAGRMPEPSFTKAVGCTIKWKK